MLRLAGASLAALAVAGWPTTPADAPRPSDTGPMMTSTADQDFEWTGRIAPGKAIEIKGINGEIRARAARGPDVMVTAEKHGRDDDPATVRIEVVEHDDGVTICAVYPNAERSRPNECSPKDRGRMNNKDNDVTVNFEVRVPAGVRLIGRTVNGDVEASGLDSDVELSTVNGSIHASTTGHALGRTVNGGLDITMGRADWSGTAEFQTVNGSIRLALPASLDTEVRAQTVNGDITTDFPLTVQGRFGPRRVSGTIGRGGRVLDLQTVNGSISLRKRGG